MSQAFDVTVIIPAYEAAEFVGDAVRGCLAQQDVSLEVIVVDDGSKVSSEAAVLAAANGDARVRFERLEVNSGPSAARNRALELARGEFIAVFDADDAMVPDRLSRMIGAAEALQADVVVDHVVRFHFDAPGREETLLLDKGMAAEPVAIDLETYLDPASDARFGAPLGYLKPLFRRSFIETHGLRYDVSLRNSEDHYFVAEMLVRGARMFLIPFAGYRYAIREGSLSHRLSPDKGRAILAAERRFRSEHAVRLTPAIIAASDRRLKAWTRLVEFEEVVEAMKQRKPGAALAAAMATPGNTLAHIGRLCSIALAKVR
ncbi:MAG: glycosyltransferase family 2 protein [Hyphomonas sp.]|uniref:glycosyltransferase family 2 protein n=1 Tax=Hyphomonas sp. TaxID=87 RepID=UPI0035287376